MSVRKQKKQGWDMELCEYQNKRLLRENKIPVLKGNVAYTVEEAVENIIEEPDTYSENDDGEEIVDNDENVDSDDSNLD